MTEQDKVTVDDIIGIVKTEEQTNSVEEVRKLRGRENKFTVYINWRNKEKGITNEVVLKDGGQPIAEITSYEDAWRLRDILNELHEENQKQKTTIRMLEQQIQRQINRNERLHKDWDRLYQYLLDMGLMTDEEILKVI